jgi:hypothetical protein
MNVSAKSGNIELLQSGWFQVVFAVPVSLTIGPLTVVLVYVGDPTSKETLTANYEPDSEKLTLTIKLSGGLPSYPTAFGSAEPFEIGHVEGHAVLMSWSISRRREDSRHYEFHYSIYHDATLAPDLPQSPQDSKVPQPPQPLPEVNS